MFVEAHVVARKMTPNSEFLGVIFGLNPFLTQMKQTGMIHNVIVTNDNGTILLSAYSLE